MSDDRAERFVSRDFRGVTLIKGQNRGPSLLANRVAKKRTPQSEQPVVPHPTLGKNDIVQSVASAAGLTKDQARMALDGALSAISVALKNGQEVRLTGFGTFSATKRKAGTARNPRTGESMTIRAAMRPKFKAGKILREAVDDLG
jgi:DNA-binding protein HU-beta